jgi:hypothetical protein
MSSNHRGSALSKVDRGSAQEPIMSRNESPCLSASALVLAALIAGLPALALAQDPGLSVGERATSFGPRFQARVGLSASLPGDFGNAALQQQAGVVLGDYYFSQVRFGLRDVSGGFRATSGLLLGQRSMMLGTPALASGQGMNFTVLRQHRMGSSSGEALSEGWSAVPYVGVGWSGVSVRGGWGLSADLGLAGRSAGGLRVNQSPGQALDDVLREWRLTPMLHLGVSYAF